ncbi:putative transcription factor WD40-like family [Dioscorea sansibarensis]
MCRIRMMNAGDEFDYLLDEGEMGNFMDYDMDGGFSDGGGGGSESEDDYALLTRVTDTSAAQARRGRDIQGIPWNRLHITRQNYRKTRLEQYKNYENIASSGELVDKNCKQMDKGGNYYEFLYNTRLVKPTILHFQLRNLVWATSKHDVYFMTNSSVNHWSSTSRALTEVLNFSGHVAPDERHNGSLLEGFSRTQISTIAVKHNLLVAGGFQGELTCKLLDRHGVSFCTRTTLDDNAITNAIDIYKNSSGGIHFMASNNDCGVREFDVERFQLINHFRFPWPVNHTSVSPDGKLVTIVGDHCDGLLVDSQDGKVLSTLVGHFDYSFASAWHPDGLTFATGNQDKTCRVWDVRNLSSSIAVLKGNLGAVRSLHYSSDGQFLTVAEPADFVHIYNTKVDYEKRQEIDLFGEISGVSLSPDDESLFIGVWDRVYASLLQYSRKHAYSYLDSYV